MYVCIYALCMYILQKKLTSIEAKIDLLLDTNNPVWYIYKLLHNIIRNVFNSYTRKLRKESQMKAVLSTN